MNKFTKYLGITAGVMMGIGLLGECTSGVYDATTNELLRDKHYEIREERIDLERQVQLYESRLECIANPQECGPPDVIEVELLPPLEVHTEMDEW